MNALQKIERRLLDGVFRQGERRAIRPLARSLSRSGDGYLHLAIPVLLALLGIRHLGQFLLLLGVSLTIERTLYFALKNTLRRRRPQDALPGFRSLITASDQFSFPSGHSSGAFLLATALTLFYGAPVSGLFLWASGVALSRVILGVHFPGDILAGALMGSSCALGTAILLGVA